MIIEREERGSQKFRDFSALIQSQSFAPIWNFMDDRWFLKRTRSPFPQRRAFRVRMQSIMIGTFDHSFPWHTHWFNDKRIKQDLQKKIEHSNSMVIVTLGQSFAPLHWLESRCSGRCAYQFYDFMLLRSPSELKERFSKETQVCIWMTTEHIGELGYAVRKCASQLSTGCVISIYFTLTTPISMERLRHMIAIWAADFMNAQIVYEKIESYSSLCQSLFASIYERCNAKLFAPQRRLGTRILGFIGITILNVFNLLINLLALAGLRSKRRSSCVILQLRKK